jgi:hypothetical protein
VAWPPALHPPRAWRWLCQDPIGGRSVLIRVEMLRPLQVRHVRHVHYPDAQRQGLALSSSRRSTSPLQLAMAASVREILNRVKSSSTLFWDTKTRTRHRSRIEPFRQAPGSCSYLLILRRSFAAAELAHFRASKSPFNVFCSSCQRGSVTAQPLFFCHDLCTMTTLVGLYRSLYVPSAGCVRLTIPQRFTL